MDSVCRSFRLHIVGTKLRALSWRNPLGSAEALKLRFRFRSTVMSCDVPHAPFPLRQDGDLPRRYSGSVTVRRKSDLNSSSVDEAQYPENGQE
jgi:hypothetical protein